MAPACRFGFAALTVTVAGATLALAQAPPPAMAPKPQAPAAAAPSPESVEKAAQALADVRKALGGDKLESLKTLVASGRTRRIRGNNLVPIEFEISIALPDKYVRVDEFPAEDADPTSAGFNGDALIQIPPPPAMPLGQARGGPSGGRGPAMDPRRARLTTVKQDYARMALGLFGASNAYPLTFSYAAVAEAPQGRADVLDAKGEGTFALRYFINSETRLPIMVTWTTPPTNVIVTVPGQPPPASVAPGAVVVAGPPAPAKDAPKEEMDKYSKEVLALRAKAQATPVEHRLYFADYREVDGLKLPFRLRRAIGTETTDETTFDRFRVNAKVDPRKFEALK